MNAKQRRKLLRILKKAKWFWGMEDVKIKKSQLYMVKKLRQRIGVN